ncbi:unnamed protein product [Trichogramma brassicae]|uniref:Uncharacterized protein n=1 Tax=Trichogramma brassicae TaxID=86971 RepID=A0A6H5HWI8_9HYME|nr:unnamed protein product [Trichogramma brassicae]
MYISCCEKSCWWWWIVEPYSGGVLRVRRAAAHGSIVTRPVFRPLLARPVRKLALNTSAAWRGVAGVGKAHAITRHNA